MAAEELIWTGNWADCREFLERVGYEVPFLHRPAVLLAECSESNGAHILHVTNTFTETEVHCDIGDRLVWYPSTRSFGVIKTP